MTNQPFQLDAIDAVVDLFEGQPQGAPEFSVVETGRWEGLFAGQVRSELGAGNQLLLSDETLLTNTRSIQLRNDIEVADPAALLESWEVFDAPANVARTCPHFSVEMETGTGKTYVYLRTVFELSRRYGFRKFVIVVPSVAIREGVLKNIEITRVLDEKRLLAPELLSQLELPLLDRHLRGPMQPRYAWLGFRVSLRSASAGRCGALHGRVDLQRRLY